LATRHSYNGPFYYDEETAKEYGEEEYFDYEKTKITEERFYLQNDSIFIWLNDYGTPADVGLEDKNTKTEELLSTSQRLQELLAGYKEEDEGY